MPPRDQLILSLRALSIRSPSTPCQASRAFTSSAVDQASTVQQRRRHRDPYAIAQANARKAANLSRREVLKTERAAGLGDPVRGITTPFVQAFDTALALQSTSLPPRSNDATAQDGSQSPDPTNIQQNDYLNFFLNKEEVGSALARSRALSAPSTSGFSTEMPDFETFEDQHTRAAEAMNRLTSLANGSSKDRLRVNIQRCIATFGRHNTEQTLPPRAPSVLQPSMQMEKIPRAGADTGSSEVQIAILTAKIRTLADFLATRGQTDKINKRNLRVLVHKRQKLLSYLRRKERGGPRWTNCIETLGLTESTWKGEISL